MQLRKRRKTTVTFFVHLSVISQILNHDIQTWLITGLFNDSFSTALIIQHILEGCM
jgi:hypothetical protein